MDILLLFLVISGFAEFLTVVQTLGFLSHGICSAHTKNKVNPLLPPCVSYRNSCGFRGIIRDTYEDKDV